MLDTTLARPSRRPQAAGPAAGRRAEQPARETFQVRDEESWTVLSTEPFPAPVDLLCEQLGRPGPWKTVRDPDGCTVRSVFELPPLAVPSADDGDDSGEPVPPLMESCLAWAQATARGRVPDGWQAPARAEVEALLPAGGLTIRSGPVALQVELVVRPDRLALAVAVLPHLLAELSAARRAWLDELLLDGQDRWRMLRVGIDGDAVVMEVDLTGCPRAALPGVLTAGSAALHVGAEWLAQSAAFLADPANPCRAAEVVPVRV